MTEVDIANALLQRLAASPSLGVIIWENRDAQPARPYLVTEIVRVSRTDPTLDGSATIHAGFLQVTVVSDVDDFATASLTIADTIAARFPYATRIAVTGGEVVIVQPPSTGQAFRDGPDWRTPVRIDYRASQ